ncbi:hypothetical protein PG994_002732 [Apiospora phragmitis]|uniref:NACHT domain-containing protein n=1 Tax=Apiospora phragmitis TaxID=2905665 RepID=A0ABR1W602_9PEZI
MPEGGVGNPQITSVLKLDSATRIRHGNLFTGFITNAGLGKGFRQVPNSTGAARPAHIANPPAPVHRFQLRALLSKGTHPDSESNDIPTSTLKWRFNASWVKRRHGRPDDNDINTRTNHIGWTLNGGTGHKKGLAYILAQDVPDLSNRIRSIFFLATPHKGSDYAATLNNILTISGILSSRDYIRDITSGSTSAQLINKDFGRCAHQLHIYSFYETLRTNLGVSTSLIVEKDSAILGPGFKNERVQYIGANHRSICKFDSPDDADYLILRNALSGDVQDLSEGVKIAKEEEKHAHMSALQSYLSNSDQPDEVFQKADGSCKWIDERDEFQDWRDCAKELLDEKKSDEQAKNPSIIWVHAKPGTGKTILAAHVASELQECELECSHYYFHAGSKASRSLSDFLRSIAYQMARSNTAVREKLTQMRNGGSTYDLDDDSTIWTKLFKKGIFQARIYTPQYWVIDALDECTKYHEFLTMLRSEKPSFPLRIFLTSRTLPDMARIHRPLQASMSLWAFQVPIESSMHDIECYIRSRTENLPLDDSSDRIELACKLLSRSNASFPWVRLVLDELEQVYSHLNGGEQVREAHRKRRFAMGCVELPRLTIAELCQALRLDIKEELPSAKSAIEGLCGQLVSVDKDTDMVDLVHPTVREFLHSDAAGEFQISKSLAHKRVASTCLKLLSGRDLQPPRGRRGSAQGRTAEPSLLDYALHFSEHIYGASSETDDLLLSLDLFFKTNILSWLGNGSDTLGDQVWDSSSAEPSVYLLSRSPAALVRKNIEDASISDDAVQLSATEGQYEPLRSARKTALCAHPSLPVVFVGNRVGQVVAFSTKTG